MAEEQQQQNNFGEFFVIIYGYLSSNVVSVFALYEYVIYLGLRRLHFFLCVSAGIGVFLASYVSFHIPIELISIY